MLKIVAVVVGSGFVRKQRARWASLSAALRKKQRHDVLATASTKLGSSLYKDQLQLEIPV